MTGGWKETLTKWDGFENFEDGEAENLRKARGMPAFRAHMIGSLFGTPIAFKIPRLLFINLCELLTCVIWRHFFLTITWLIGETGQHPWFSLNLEDIGGI